MTRRTRIEPTTLEQINALANDRHRLYRIAGREGNRADKAAARLRIPELTRQLERLWAVHRAELAGVHRRPIRLTPVAYAYDDVFEDYLERARTASPVERLDDLDGFTIDLMPVIWSLRRDVIENPPPLCEVLARRGETLVWPRGESGSGVVRKVAEKVG